MAWRGCYKRDAPLLLFVMQSRKWKSVYHYIHFTLSCICEWLDALFSALLSENERSQLYFSRYGITSSMYNKHLFYN